MIASSAQQQVARAPRVACTTTTTGRRLSVACQASAQTRRGLLAGVAGAAAAAALSIPSSAKAFGVGFPGYDVNLDARRRAQERIKAEMDRDMQKAAEFRAARDAKLKAEKEAKEAAAKAAAAQPAPAPVAAAAAPAVAQE